MLLPLAGWGSNIAQISSEVAKERTATLQCNYHMLLLARTHSSTLDQVRLLLLYSFVLPGLPKLIATMRHSVHWEPFGFHSAAAIK